MDELDRHTVSGSAPTRHRLVRGWQHVACRRMMHFDSHTPLSGRVALECRRESVPRDQPPGREAMCEHQGDRVCDRRSQRCSCVPARPAPGNHTHRRRLPAVTCHGYPALSAWGGCNVDRASCGSLSASEPPTWSPRAAAERSITGRCFVKGAASVRCRTSDGRAAILVVARPGGIAWQARSADYLHPARPPSVWALSRFMGTFNSSPPAGLIAGLFPLCDNSQSGGCSTTVGP